MDKLYKKRTCKCYICGGKFLNKAGLSSHLTRIHPDRDAMPVDEAPELSRAGGQPPNEFLPMEQDWNPPSPHGDQDNPGQARPTTSTDGTRRIQQSTVDTSLRVEKHPFISGNVTFEYYNESMYMLTQ